eukprot:489357-Alexandrium_andersonii.AAC.1
MPHCWAVELAWHMFIASHQTRQEITTRAPFPNPARPTAWPKLAHMQHAEVPLAHIGRPLRDNSAGTTPI